MIQQTIGQGVVSAVSVLFGTTVVITGLGARWVRQNLDPDSGMAVMIGLGIELLVTAWLAAGVYVAALMLDGRYESPFGPPRQFRTVGRPAGRRLALRLAWGLFTARVAFIVTPGHDSPSQAARMALALSMVAAAVLASVHITAATLALNGMISLPEGGFFERRELAYALCAGAVMCGIVAGKCIEDFYAVRRGRAHRRRLAEEVNLEDGTV